VVRVARAAGAAGPRVVLNPSPPVSLPAQVLAACDPLVVNEHGARALLGDHPAGHEAGTGAPEAWASALLALGPRSVVVTLGAAGALAADRRGAVRVDSTPVEVVDTTGAGDCFSAALGFGLAEGHDAGQAARFAVAAAALAVTRPGAQATPSRAEVEAFIRRRDRAGGS
jgi:ribokinase